MTSSRRPSRDKRPRADLPLADLQRFEASELLNTDERELAAFMVMAALAFNDLKDVAVAEGALLKSQPPKEKLDSITPERGEYTGQRAHVHRVLVAILNEVMELIAAHRHLFESTTFTRCLGQMPPFASRAWDALMDASQGYVRGGKGDRKLRTALVSVRANVAFHYYQPGGLATGLATFGAHPGTPAFVSLGRNAESSRFYFADAAAQSYLDSSLKAGALSLEEMMDYAGHVLDSLRHLVEAYLRERRLI